MQDLFRSISTLFRSADANEKAREAVIFAAWSRVSGDQISCHAVPLRFSGSRLTVAVSGVRWQQQLCELAPQIVFKLNAVFGLPVLKFIEFVVDENAVRERTRKTDQPLPRAYEPPTPQLLAAASKIEDEKLRSDFLAAAAASTTRYNRRQTMLDR